MKIDSNRLQTYIDKISNVPVVKAVGEIDVYSAPRLKAASRKAAIMSAADIVVDLSEISYMDSSGFGALLSAAKQLKPKGGALSLAGCSEAIERMLSITRLNLIFDTFPTPYDAVKAITGSDPT